MTYRQYIIPGSLAQLSDLIEKSDRGYFYKYIAMLVVVSIFSVFSVSSIIPLLYLLIKPEKLSKIPLINRMSYHNSISLLVAIICGLFVLRSAASVCILAKQQKYIADISVKLRCKIFNAYLTTSYEYMRAKNTSNIINLINNEVTLVVNQSVAQLAIFFNELIYFLIAYFFLLAVDVKFTIVMTCSMVFALMTLLKFTKSQTRKHSLNRISASQSLNKLINHSIGCLMETKLYKKEYFFTRLLKKSASESAKSLRYYRIYNQLSRHIIEPLLVCLVLSSLLLFIWLDYSANSLTIIISTFGLIAVQLIPSTNRLMQSYTSISYAKPSLDNLLEEYKKARENSCSFNHKLTTRNAKHRLFDSSIYLHNINFSYGKHSVLSNINLTIKKGSKVAITGASGAGKTTLINIILGLIAPDSGEFFIDGRKVGPKNDTQWGSLFAYIPQTIYLFDTSIRENIAFGEVIDVIDDDKIWQVLGQASLKDFVAQLPDGINTIIGENGIRLSGGQRQRLGIARALYRDAAILVMDEATSSLDNETEASITATLDSLPEDITMITIAHRRSTIEKYDIIYSLSNSHIYINREVKAESCYIS